MENRVMGYARVSSREQNLDRQIIALKEYVPEENIVIDKASGKDLMRPGYQALKGALGLRKGDILYIKSLDRLSRNKEDIKNELQWFKHNGITLKVIDLPTTMVEIGKGQEWIRDMINNILIEVLSSIAEEERRTISPEGWELYYLRYKAGEVKRSYVIKKLGIGPNRFDYLKRKYELSHGKS